MSGRAAEEEARGLYPTPPGFFVDDGPEKEKEGGKDRRRGPGDSRCRAASSSQREERRCPGGGRGTRRRWMEDATLPSEHGTAGRCGGRRTGPTVGPGDSGGPGRKKSPGKLEHLAPSILSIVKS